MTWWRRFTYASAWFFDDVVMGDIFFSGFCSDSRYNLLNVLRNLKDSVVCSLSEAKQSQSKHLRCWSLLCNSCALVLVLRKATRQSVQNDGNGTPSKHCVTNRAWRRLCCWRVGWALGTPWAVCAARDAESAHLPRAPRHAAPSRSSSSQRRAFSGETNSYPNRTKNRMLF